MNAIWQWVKKHPYLTAGATVIVVAGIWNYTENNRIAKKREEEIQRNRQRSQKREEERRRALEATTTTTTSSATSSPTTTHAFTTATTTLTTTQDSGSAAEFSAEAEFQAKFITVTLEQYAGKWVLLFFYPGNWASASKLLEFENSIGKFSALNCALIGCATELKVSHQAWNSIGRSSGGGGNVGYPLIADPRQKIGPLYSVGLSDGGKYQEAWRLIAPNGSVAASGSGLDVGRIFLELQKRAE